MKNCSNCKKELSESQFGNDRTRPDGKSYWCKHCKKICIDSWRRANREKVSEQARKAYHKDIEASRDTARRKKARYYYKDLELSRAKARERYANNREVIKVRRNCYKGTAQGRYNGIKSKARKLGVALASKEAFVAWYKQQDNLCTYCGQELVRSKKMGGLTIDRKDARKGYTEDNIVLSCRRCNTAKGYWFTYEAMKEIARQYFVGKELE